jgi:hypothetical protein
MGQIGVLNSFEEIKYLEKKHKHAIVEKGANLLSKVYGAALSPVFYMSRFHEDGTLSLQNIVGDINWGEAVELILYEGFYMFGGRNETG